MALKASAVLAAFVVAPSVALRTLLRSNDTKEVSYGDSKCQCVGIDGLTGKTEVKINGETLTDLYPTELGSSCEAWDDGLYPGCDGSSSQPSWCTAKWCYVDPCDCTIGTNPTTSSYLEGATYEGKQIFYSYATCGNDNTYNEPPSDLQTSECSKEWDEDKFGTEACPCVGIDGLKGSTDVIIGGVTYPDLYPAEIGSSCEAWDDGKYPGSCDGSAKADWCGKSWCYVNPSNCVVDSGPFKSTYIPHGMFQGSELYYSYVTCKSDNTYD